MKGFIFCMLCVLTLGLLYCAAQNGTLDALLSRFAPAEAQEPAPRDSGMSVQERDDMIMAHRTRIRMGPGWAPDPANAWNRIPTSWEQRDRDAFASHVQAGIEHDANVRWGRERSGVRDLDDAMLAQDRLTRCDPDHWPLERIARTAGARTLWNAMPSYRAEGGEEFIGASESTPPGWTGAPLGRPRPPRERVSTGKAIQRFIFGVPDEERRRL